MGLNAPAIEPRRAVRVAAVACVIAAVLAVLAFALAGQPTAGGALGTGLLLGAVNGAIAARLLVLPIPFVASSLLRIMTLSVVGLAIGLAFGLSRIWLVILGLGLSQFCLAAAALREGRR